MSKKPKIIALTGPSATGKSALAVDIAKNFNGEIISADSRYVYKYLDIASAKPNIQEQQGIVHHLINITEVTEEYTAGLFVKDSAKSIQDILLKNKTPIVAGGTGLYFRSLSGEFDIPEVKPDKNFREAAENISNEILYNELLNSNPDLAKKIHPNNKVKIVRALEITRSGAKLTSKESPYDILWIGLNASDREFLYNRAESRVDNMFEQGLLDEAKMLFDKYGMNKILLNTIGIKELYACIFGNKDIEFATDEIKKNTRHYIKRQISWFNNDKNTNWLQIDKNIDYAGCANSLVDKFLST